MSNQDFGDQATSDGSATRGKKRAVRETASEALSQVSGMAKDAGSKAKQAASEATFTVTEQIKEMLDKQIGTGAATAGLFASSVRLAADDFAQQSPLLGGFVRTFADKIEDYAEDLQHQTVEHVVRSASDFTRKQPALVFGLAALAGFFVFRTLKSAPATDSPSIQPNQDFSQPEQHSSQQRTYRSPAG